MGNGFTYLINLNVGGMGAIGKLLSMLDSLDNRIGHLEQGMDKFNRGLDQAGAKGRSAFGGIGSSIASIAAQVGVAATAMSSLNTAVDVDSTARSIRFAGGAEGAANLEFVQKAAEDLRVPLSAATEGFKTLSGGMMGTRITMEQQRDIFKAVGEASTVMGLSADQSQGAFIALSQMASKGTVSAEELRGQLGERIPGAFNIAARAMGVSTMELGKMMEQGKVVSEDFLPKFATELHKTFGPGMTEAINSPRAMMNQMGNEVLLLKNDIGLALLPVASKLIHDVLIPGARWFRENSDAIFTVAGAFGVAYTAIKAHNTIMAIHAAITTIQTAATTGFTGTILGLNAALWANPITWVVGGIIALGAAVIYSWKHFEGFRGFVVGMWEVLKELGHIMYERVVLPFMSFGKIVAGVLTFDADMIANGMSDAVKFSESWSTSAGQRVGNAFTEGWNQGVSNFADNVPDPRAAFEGARDDRQGALGAQGIGATSPGILPTPPGTDKGSKMANSITGGGQRNVTINLGSLNDGGITINTQKLEEGADQMVEMLTRKLLQIINSANQVQLN